jgi:FkbH-like protein
MSPFRIAAIGICSLQDRTLQADCWRGDLYHDLDWLPERTDWASLTDAIRHQEPREALDTLRLLANSRMDFVRAVRLDKMLQRYRSLHDVSPFLPHLRFALIGSSTLSHLHPGIRLAALRRGILLDIYQGNYGMYRQELMDPASGLHNFQPDVVLLALDAHHLAEAENADAENILAMLRSCWNAARESLGCSVIQQTVLPVHPHLLGNQEFQYPVSPAAIVARVNALLRDEAPKANVHLLTVDAWAAMGGIVEWFEPSLWYRSKQEIHPRVSNLYGDQVGRILAALRGKSSKCLVLDLDNTLWGGVVGDDGVDGIVIGQGGETGEAFVALQRYAKALSQRGVILAVCSKNDEANALLPFEQRSEMILRRTDIACFVANWEDKASNLRRIAKQLNIGLDSLVFVDDNPFERNLVRRELPMVAVLELPEDPSGYVSLLSAAGYFETLSITDEDRERSQQYRANLAREELRENTTDMHGFLRALKMKLTWSPFACKDLKRVVQLLNKTNQFNLTTRRYSEEGVQALLADRNALTLQLRLIDVYGNNGIIALLIGRRNTNAELEIETWLMSCRVLGRQVEQVTLNILLEEAREIGCRHLVGYYRPTASNAMVRSHYEKLGFTLLHTAEDGNTSWRCSVDHMPPLATEIEIFEEDEYGVARDLQAAH